VSKTKIVHHGSINKVLQLIRKKYKALKQYRRATADRKRKLRSVAQQIKYLIRSKHRGNLAKIESSFCDNLKLFWSYHKSILHHRTGHSNEITYNGVTAKTAKEKADLFNTYFSSVFRPSSTTCNQTPRTESEGNISEITLDVDEVAQFFRALDTSKACGPDGIPARLLQVCALQIAPSICELFNRSLHTGHVPSEWKSANVTPVHKKDLKEPAEHYRSISLLPIVGKVLERFVCIRLYISMLETLSQKHNMASLDGDLALVNYYRYYTPSDNPLTKTLKRTLSTSVLRKHLTLSITKFFSTSLRHTVCQVTYMNGSRSISVVVTKGLWLMELHLIGCQLHLEFRKQSPGPCSVCDIHKRSSRHIT
jgi:hypothetical protein